MIDITFFNRNSKAGYSIAKVFKPLKSSLKTESYIVKDFYCPEFGASPLKVLKNLCYIYKNRSKRGVNHITGDIYYGIIALIGCKSVITYHDLAFIKNAKNPLDKFIKKWLWIKLPLYLSGSVICISEQTEKELKKYNPKKDIKIIPNPLSDEFIYTPKNFNEEKPIILHIGTGWNKNLKNTILALKGIVCHLRIIGKLKDEDYNLLEKNKIDYSNDFNLTDEQIVLEYKRCDIVNFPSFYEGFGMPIIEGQSIGRPVITSNISPMKEIIDDDLLLVDPKNVEQLNQIYHLILKDKNIYNNLVIKGLKNSEKYSKNLILDQYLRIYNELK